MSAILEIPEVRRRVSRLSVEEYHRLDEFNNNGRRTELIRGIVIGKIGSVGTLQCATVTAVRILVSDLFA